MNRDIQTKVSENSGQDTAVLTLAQALDQPSSLFDRLNYRSYQYNREMHPHVPVSGWAHIWGDAVFFFEVRYQHSLNCAFDLEVASSDPEFCPSLKSCSKCGMCAVHCKLGQQGGCGTVVA